MCDYKYTLTTCQNWYDTSSDRLDGLHAIKNHFLSFYYPPSEIVFHGEQLHSPLLFLAPASCCNQGYFRPRNHSLTSELFRLSNLSLPPIYFNIFKYSRGSYTEHSNSEYIRIPNVLKFRFRTVRFSNHHSITELFKMAAIA